jgi:methionine synthase I (cobalamin-dependent)
MQDCEAMTSPQYDIFEQREAELIWIETSRDLNAAKKRIEELVAQNKRQYVVYDQRTKRIVATCG